MAKEWTPATIADVAQARQRAWAIEQLMKYGSKSEAASRLKDPLYKAQVEWAKKNPKASPLTRKQKS